MSPEVVAEAFRLGGVYHQPSRNDLFALALAKHHGCPLLTGDSRLRQAAEQESIEVRGTLWLMEAMYEAGIITIDELQAAYDRMRDENRRLPWDEVEAQLARLRQRR
jgi:predicted nucleic acid-binding protein